MHQCILQELINNQITKIQIIKQFQQSKNPKADQHHNKMSFLQYVDVDSHIHLFALQKLKREQTQETIKQKIHHLLQTRRFDDIQAQAKKLTDLAFPDLPAKLEQARKASEEEKKKLGCDQVDATLTKLDQLAAKDDPADDSFIDREHNKIYLLSRIYYEQGKYQKSYELMKKLERQYLNSVLQIKTTWARLYCQIILQNPKVRRTVQKLKGKMDQFEEKEKSYRRRLNYLEQDESVKQSYGRRKQFLILITIAYFLQSKEESFQKYVTFCTDEENSAVLQLVCPYIIRYICVALLLNKTLHKNRKFDLFTLIEGIRRKIYKYSDPFIEFLSALCIQFDFQQAKAKITEIKNSLSNDFLLKPLQSKIIQNCNFLYYKIFCKVHERVPLSQIAEFTGKTEQQAQFWILGFIRSLDIQAKIDSVDRAVLSSRDEESMNEKYIDLIPKMNTFINIVSQSVNNQP